MGRVAGKTAIVTGAGSRTSLGFATAAMLAREGALVALTDIDEAGAVDSAALLSKEGYQAIGLKQDVASEEDWRAVIAATLDAFGKLDILVNNAGIIIPGGVETLSPADFRRQIDVNLTGTFLGAAAAVPAMRANGGGSIINLSSVAGLVGYAGMPAYNASKGGVRLMTKSIALEYAEAGIRCNSVHPGKIWTAMMEGFAVHVGGAETLTADIPMRRLGKPDDIAHCILFLASDESGYVTGAEFVVDGGLTAQ